MPEKYSLKVGDRAPEFTLQSSTGAEVSLRDFRGRAEVIVFFFPKASSPFCSAEACAFRAEDKTFQETGTEVIGISSDSPSGLQRFKSLFALPFVLLSDPEGEVRRSYGVSKTFGLLPGRATFLIDREGYVRHIYASQFLPTKHASEMLEALQRMRDPKE